MQKKNKVGRPKGEKTEAIRVPSKCIPAIKKLVKEYKTQKV
jgi:hypothetical protein